MGQGASHAGGGATPHAWRDADLPLSPLRLGGSPRRHLSLLTPSAAAGRVVDADGVTTLGLGPSSAPLTEVFEALMGAPEDMPPAALEGAATAALRLRAQHAALDALVGASTGVAATRQHLLEAFLLTINTTASPSQATSRALFAHLRQAVDTLRGRRLGLRLLVEEQATAARVDASLCVPGGKAPAADTAAGTLLPPCPPQFDFLAAAHGHFHLAFLNMLAKTDAAAATTLIATVDAQLGGVPAVEGPSAEFLRQYADALWGLVDVLPPEDLLPPLVRATCRAPTGPAYLRLVRHLWASPAAHAHIPASATLRHPLRVPTGGAIQQGSSSIADGGVSLEVATSAAPGGPRIPLSSAYWSCAVDGHRVVVLVGNTLYVAHAGGAAGVHVARLPWQWSDMRLTAVVSASGNLYVFAVPLDRTQTVLMHLMDRTTFEMASTVATGALHAKLQALCEDECEARVFGDGGRHVFVAHPLDVVAMPVASGRVANLWCGIRVDVFDTVSVVGGDCLRCVVLGAGSWCQSMVPADTDVRDQPARGGVVGVPMLMEPPRAVAEFSVDSARESDTVYDMVLDTPNMRVAAPGEVVSWNIRVVLPSVVTVRVWRPVAAGKYALVGDHAFCCSPYQASTYAVPDNEVFRVEAGDVLGVALRWEHTVNMFPLEAAGGAPPAEPALSQLNAVDPRCPPEHQLLFSAHGSTAGFEVVGTTCVFGTVPGWGPSQFQPLIGANIRHHLPPPPPQPVTSPPWSPRTGATTPRAHAGTPARPGMTPRLASPRHPQGSPFSSPVRVAATPTRRVLPPPGLRTPAVGRAAAATSAGGPSAVEVGLETCQFLAASTIAFYTNGDSVGVLGSAVVPAEDATDAGADQVAPIRLGCEFSVLDGLPRSAIIGSKFLPVVLSYDVWHNDMYSLTLPLASTPAPATRAADVTCAAVRHAGLRGAALRHHVDAALGAATIAWPDALPHVVRHVMAAAHTTGALLCGSGSWAHPCEYGCLLGACVEVDAGATVRAVCMYVDSGVDAGGNGVLAAALRALVAQGVIGGGGLAAWQALPSRGADTRNLGPWWELGGGTPADVRATAVAAAARDFVLPSDFRGRRLASHIATEALEASGVVVAAWLLGIASDSGALLSPWAAWAHPDDLGTALHAVAVACGDATLLTAVYNATVGTGVAAPALYALVGHGVVPQDAVAAWWEALEPLPPCPHVAAWVDGGAAPPPPSLPPSDLPPSDEPDFSTALPAFATGMEAPPGDGGPGAWPAQHLPMAILAAGPADASEIDEMNLLCDGGFVETDTVEVDVCRVALLSPQPAWLFAGGASPMQHPTGGAAVDDVWSPREAACGVLRRLLRLDTHRHMIKTQARVTTGIVEAGTALVVVAGVNFLMPLPDGVRLAVVHWGTPPRLATVSEHQPQFPKRFPCVEEVPTGAASSDTLSADTLSALLDVLRDVRDEAVAVMEANTPPSDADAATAMWHLLHLLHVLLAEMKQAPDVAGRLKAASYTDGSPLLGAIRAELLAVCQATVAHCAPCDAAAVLPVVPTHVHRGATLYQAALQCLAVGFDVLFGGELGAAALQAALSPDADKAQVYAALLGAVDGSDALETVLDAVLTSPTQLRDTLSAAVAVLRAHLRGVVGNGAPMVTPAVALLHTLHNQLLVQDAMDDAIAWGHFVDLTTCFTDALEAVLGLDSPHAAATAGSALFRPPTGLLLPVLTMHLSASFSATRPPPEDDLHATFRATLRCLRLLRKALGRPWWPSVDTAAAQLASQVVAVCAHLAATVACGALCADAALPSMSPGDAVAVLDPSGLIGVQPAPPSPLPGEWLAQDLLHGGLGATSPALDTLIASAVGGDSAPAAWACALQADAHARALAALSRTAFRAAGGHTYGQEAVDGAERALAAAIVHHIGAGGAAAAACGAWVAAGAVAGDAAGSAPAPVLWAWRVARRLRRWLRSHTLDNSHDEDDRDAVARGAWARALCLLRFHAAAGAPLPTPPLQARTPAPDAASPPPPPLVRSASWSYAARAEEVPLVPHPPLQRTGSSFGRLWKQASRRAGVVESPTPRGLSYQSAPSSPRAPAVPAADGSDPAWRNTAHDTFAFVTSVGADAVGVLTAAHANQVAAGKRATALAMLCDILAVMLPAGRSVPSAAMSRAADAVLDVLVGSLLFHGGPPPEAATRFQAAASLLNPPGVGAAVSAALQTARVRLLVQLREVLSGGGAPGGTALTAAPLAALPPWPAPPATLDVAVSTTAALAFLTVRFSLRVEALPSPESTGPNGLTLPLRVGQHLFARYRNSGLFPGVIAAENASGTFSIQFDDGDRDNNVPLHNIFPTASGIAGKPRRVLLRQRRSGALGLAFPPAEGTPVATSTARNLVYHVASCDAAGSVSTAPTAQDGSLTMTAAQAAAASQSPPFRQKLEVLCTAAGNLSVRVKTLEGGPVPQVHSVFTPKPVVPGEWYDVCVSVMPADGRRRLAVVGIAMTPLQSPRPEALPERLFTTMTAPVCPRAPYVQLGPSAAKIPGQLVDCDVQDVVVQPFAANLVGDAAALVPLPPVPALPPPPRNVGMPPLRGAEAVPRSLAGATRALVLLPVLSPPSGVGGSRSPMVAGVMEAVLARFCEDAAAMPLAVGTLMAGTPFGSPKLAVDAAPGAVQDVSATTHVTASCNANAAGLLVAPGVPQGVVWVTVPEAAAGGGSGPPLSVLGGGRRPIAVLEVHVPPAAQSSFCELSLVLPGASDVGLPAAVGVAVSSVTRPPPPRVGGSGCGAGVAAMRPAAGEFRGARAVAVPSEPGAAVQLLSLADLTSAGLPPADFPVARIRIEILSVHGPRRDAVAHLAGLRVLRCAPPPTTNVVHLNLMLAMFHRLALTASQGATAEAAVAQLAALLSAASATPMPATVPPASWPHKAALPPPAEHALLRVLADRGLPSGVPVATHLLRHSPHASTRFLCLKVLWGGLATLHPAAAGDALASVMGLVGGLCATTAAGEGVPAWECAATGVVAPAPRARRTLPPPPPVGLACEAVALVRHLASVSQDWAAAVRATCVRALAAVDGALSAEACGGALVEAAAALLVMGGHLEPVRAGGRAEWTPVSPPHEGIPAVFHPNAPLCVVWCGDNGTEGPPAPPVAHVVPVEDVGSFMGEEDAATVTAVSVADLTGVDTVPPVSGLVPLASVAPFFANVCRWEGVDPVAASAAAGGFLPLYQELRALAVRALHRLTAAPSPRRDAATQPPWVQELFSSDSADVRRLLLEVFQAPSQGLSPALTALVAPFRGPTPAPLPGLSEHLRVVAGVMAAGAPAAAATTPGPSPSLWQPPVVAASTPVPHRLAVSLCATPKSAVASVRMAADPEDSDEAEAPAVLLCRGSLPPSSPVTFICDVTKHTVLLVVLREALAAQAASLPSPTGAFEPLASTPAGDAGGGVDDSIPLQGGDAAPFGAASHGAVQTNIVHTTPDRVAAVVAACQRLPQVPVVVLCTRSQQEAEGLGADFSVELPTAHASALRSLLDTPTAVSSAPVLFVPEYVGLAMEGTMFDLVEWSAGLNVGDAVDYMLPAAELLQTPGVGVWAPGAVYAVNEADTRWLRVAAPSQPLEACRWVSRVTDGVAVPLGTPPLASPIAGRFRYGPNTIAPLGWVTGWYSPACAPPPTSAHLTGALRAWRRSLVTGDEIDAKDTMGKWYNVVILAHDDSSVQVRYVGWASRPSESRWDEWLQRDSPRLAFPSTKVHPWKQVYVGSPVLYSASDSGGRSRFTRHLVTGVNLEDRTVSLSTGSPDFVSLDDVFRMCNIVTHEHFSSRLTDREAELPPIPEPLVATHDVTGLGLGTGGASATGPVSIPLAPFDLLTGGGGGDARGQVDPKWTADVLALEGLPPDATTASAVGRFVLGGARPGGSLLPASRTMQLWRGAGGTLAGDGDLACPPPVAVGAFGLVDLPLETAAFPFEHPHAVALALGNVSTSDPSPMMAAVGAAVKADTAVRAPADAAIVSFTVWVRVRSVPDAPADALVFPLEVGAALYAKYRNSSWYPGRVSAVNYDGTYDVAYDDGDKEDAVPPARLSKTQPSSSQATAAVARCILEQGGDAVEGGLDADGVWKVGAKVRAKYRGASWYPGTIRTVVTRDPAVYHIDYDDGDREDDVPGERVESRTRAVEKVVLGLSDAGRLMVAVTGVSQGAIVLAPRRMVAGEWTHVAVVAAGAELRLFVDGHKVAAAASPSLPHRNTLSYGGGGAAADAVLRHVNGYDVALTEEHVQADMAGACVRVVPVLAGLPPAPARGGFATTTDSTPAVAHAAATISTKSMAAAWKASAASLMRSFVSGVEGGAGAPAPAVVQPSVVEDALHGAAPGAVRRYAHGLLVAQRGLYLQQAAIELLAQSTGPVFADVVARLGPSRVVAVVRAAAVAGVVAVRGVVRVEESKAEVVERESKEGGEDEVEEPPPRGHDALANLVGGLLATDGPSGDMFQALLSEAIGGVATHVAVTQSVARTAHLPADDVRFSCRLLAALTLHLVPAPAMAASPGADDARIGAVFRRETVSLLVAAMGCCRGRTQAVVMTVLRQVLERVGVFRTPPLQEVSFLLALCEEFEFMMAGDAATDSKFFVAMAHLLAVAYGVQRHLLNAQGPAAAVPSIHDAALEWAALPPEPSPAVDTPASAGSAAYATPSPSAHLPRFMSPSMTPADMVAMSTGRPLRFTARSPLAPAVSPEAVAEHTPILVAMGFTQDEASRALETANGDVDEATALLTGEGGAGGGREEAGASREAQFKLTPWLWSVLEFVDDGLQPGRGLFTTPMDAALVDALTSKAVELRRSPAALKASHFPEDELAALAEGFGGMTPSDVLVRVGELVEFNSRVAALSMTSGLWVGMAPAGVARLQAVVSRLVKRDALATQLRKATKPISGPSVTLLRSQNPRRNLFLQLMRGVGGDEHLTALRHCAADTRPWHVKEFVGEGGLDMGGPFNSSLTYATTAVMDPRLAHPTTPPFIPSPNCVHQVGLNRDKLVPNPAATSAAHLRMFHFLGRLMGVSLRMNFQLPLRLASFVWKAMLGGEITLADVEEVDQVFVQAMRGVEAAVDAGTLSDTPWTVPSFGGGAVALIPGGGSKYLTPADVPSYVAKALEARRAEVAVACDALAAGLDSVVPLSQLVLFRPEELELQVCGPATLDVATLRANTKLSGYGPDSPYVQRFWEVLGAMSPEEQGQVLSFVWARTRLPPAGTTFTQQFRLSRLDTGAHDPDGYLPVAHTCLFRLELPAYSTATVMRRQLLTATQHMYYDLDRHFGDTADVDADDSELAVLDGQLEEFVVG